MARPPETYPTDVRETFEYCPNCETLTVSVDQHTCPTGAPAGRPSPEERGERAAADDRPSEEDVLYPKGRSQNKAWAYHELDEDGEPRCGADHSAGAVIGPRAEAIEQGCYPCGRCRSLEDGDE
jgi:hypothetical protein